MERHFTMLGLSKVVKVTHGHSTGFDNATVVCKTDILTATQNG